MGCKTSKAKNPVKPNHKESLDYIRRASVNPGNYVAEHTAEDAKFHDLYNVSKVLGEGAFGKVMLAKHNATQRDRAVKEISKEYLSEENKVALINEVRTMQSLDHPNIVRLFEVFDQTDNIYLVMELVKGKELYDEIIARDHFNEAETASVIIQLLQAVYYCHQNNIVHRDIKPENLLVSDEGVVTLVDFGTSRFYGENVTMKAKRGSSYYMAPEVIKGSYNQKCDNWSIGCVVYIMLSGWPPFNGPTDADIFNAIKKGKYSTSGDIWDGISDDCKDFISKLLEMNQDKRLSTKEALEHPWILANKTEVKIDKKMLTTGIQVLKFRSKSADRKLARSFLTYAATRLATDEAMEKLKESFQFVDKAGNGRISYNEMIIVTKELHPGISDEKADLVVKEFFNITDMDDSGYLTYSEWVTSMIDYRSIVNKENLKQAFDLFDVSQTGYINKRDIILCLGENFTKNEDQWLKTLKNKLQTNEKLAKQQDGLSFEQFQKLILNFYDEIDKEESKLQFRQAYNENRSALSSRENFDSLIAFVSKSYVQDEQAIQKPQ